MLAIEAQDVVKTFRAGWIRRRETAALDGISLAVPRGIIFGLLGMFGGSLDGFNRVGQQASIQLAIQNNPHKLAASILRSQATGCAQGRRP